MFPDLLEEELQATRRRGLAGEGRVNDRLVLASSREASVRGTGKTAMAKGWSRRDEDSGIRVQCNGKHIEVGG